MTKIIIKKPEEEEGQIQNIKDVEVEEKTIFDKKEDKPPLQVSLNMRKGLDGRVIVFDHDHIDIVYLPSKNKIVAFAKQDFSDIVYETEMRLFDFLVEKGICAPESVQGSNVYGSMEAEILKPTEQIPVSHLLLLNLEKWIDSERPSLEMDKQYTQAFTDMMTQPDSEESTELGEVPHEEDKGSIPKNNMLKYRGGWW